jgi:molybdopterin converting factor small subunit
MITVPVRLPTPLRAFAEGRAEVEVPAETVGEALSTLAARYPTLRRHLYGENGALRDYVNAFVNEDDVRVLDGAATRLAPGDRVTILPSIAGG